MTSQPPRAEDLEAAARSEHVADGHAYYALAGVFLVLTFSLIDRNILSILLVDIKAEFQVSDTAMGFLTGLAFAVTNAFAGIPLARLADRRSRTVIISAGLAVWSVLTGLQGLVQSFFLLALARIGVGIGEASTGPATHSLLSDLFSPKRRATAIAVYTMGGHFGVLIGMVVGGWLNENFGWRVALIAVGLPGLLVAALFALTVREPIRGQSESRKVVEEEPEPFWTVVRYLWSKPTYRHLMFCGPLFIAAFYAMNFWGPAFLIRVHGLSSGEVGMRLGPILGICGALGTILGGYFCDRLATRDLRWYILVPAINGAAMIPFLLGFLLWPDPEIALICLGPMVFLGGTALAPLYTVALGVAKLRMRATASAVLHLAISMVAAGIVPQLIGILNDLLEGSYGDEAVRYSLFLIVGTNVWAVVHALLAARSLRQDFASAAADDI